PPLHRRWKIGHIRLRDGSDSGRASGSKQLGNLLIDLILERSAPPGGDSDARGGPGDDHTASKDEKASPVHRITSNRASVGLVRRYARQDRVRIRSLEA